MVTALSHIVPPGSNDSYHPDPQAAGTPQLETDY
jgi:hypothetical protein